MNSNNINKKVIDFAVAFIKAHLFSIPLVIIILIISAFGDSGRDLLKYSRILIEQGEYWRIITAHFVHAGIEHTFLNISGICIIAFLFEDNSTPIKWWATLIIMMLLSSACYYYIDPDLGWYVGISGVLHGFFILGGISEWRNDKLISVCVVVALVGKLIYGQIYGPPESTEEMIGVAVYENAHLFGGILAIVIGVCFGWFLFKKPAALQKTNKEESTEQESSQ